VTQFTTADECVHTDDTTKLFRRVGVGGVYWALVNVVDYRYQLTVTVIVKCQMLRGKPKSLQMIKLRLIPKNNLYMGSKARDTRKILKQPEMTPTRHWL